MRKYFTPGISRLYRIRSTVELTIREGGERNQGGRKRGGRKGRPGRRERYGGMGEGGTEGEREGERELALYSHSRFNLDLVCV